MFGEPDWSIVNGPMDGHAVEHDLSRVPPPFKSWRGKEPTFLKCVCGSKQFFVFKYDGDYSTWVQCVGCSLGEEVHSG